MSAGTTTPDDLHRAVLLSQRAALLAALPVVVARPDLKAGAVQWLGALEDALGMERTIPRRDERRAARLTTEAHT
jgi:hypothetical protein